MAERCLDAAIILLQFRQLPDYRDRLLSWKPAIYNHPGSIHSLRGIRRRAVDYASRLCPFKCG